MSRLFALFLAGYGLAHPILIGPVSGSWVAGSLGVDAWAVNASACALGGFAIVGYLLAAAAVAGVVVPRRWWQPLVIASSVASAMVLTVGFGPATLPGLVTDACLVWIALRTPTPLAAALGQ